MTRYSTLQELETRQKEVRAAAPRRTIAVCDTGCLAVGSGRVANALAEEIARQGVGDRVRLKRTGCHGFCEQGPVMVIHPERSFYPRVSADDAAEIVHSAATDGRPIERLQYADPASGERLSCDEEVPFYRAQTRVVFRHNVDLDPVDLDDYIAHDGYQAAARALARTPAAIVDDIKAAGLRGRGGAGFLTGVKWALCAQQPGPEKYLICNADEGDPGAFMDRSLLEGSPHAILEGMIIAGFAVGAAHGLIYVRTEYPIAVRHARSAIDQARAVGLLGDNILGSGFSFDITIHEGAGAFVCGEETALIASLEGERGMPRPRPPFPAQSGYRGKPTTINNVETLANIAPIMLHGPAWYAAIGTEKSKGTKIFALAGKVVNTGLIEVPMGTSLRQIVFDIGGGVPGGRSFKAAQMGGPSGGCLPAQYLDIPIDYDSVRQAGAIMGSGGLIVLDDSTCMVDIARYFLQFTQNESCGKCVPCRIGTRRMLEILVRITEGKGEPDDIAALEQLSQTVKATSLCGLGQTAPNPVLSTLRHFRDEYEAHVYDKRCPAGYCKALRRYSIVAETCTGCRACAKACPSGAIAGQSKRPHRIDPALCTRCGACVEACKYDAVLVN